MPPKEAHTCPFAPEDGHYTLDPTNPPGTTDHLWAQEDLATPRSQTSL